MQCLSASVAELEQELVVQPILHMSESILTACYRNNSISDAERQSIINAAVAEIDSSKPKYKNIGITVEKRGYSGGSADQTFYHGMKTIQTAKLICSEDVYWDAWSGTGDVVLTAGSEVPFSTAVTTLARYKNSNTGGGVALGIKYGSSNVTISVTWRDGTYWINSFTAILQFYGTY